MKRQNQFDEVMIVNPAENGTNTEQRVRLMRFSNNYPPQFEGYAAPEPYGYYAQPQPYGYYGQPAQYGYYGEPDFYGYYGEDTLDAGYEAFDDRLDQIAERDKYPEFDVPDFDGLAAPWHAWQRGLSAHPDLQPVVLDQCLRLSLGPLPATRTPACARQRAN